MDKIGGLIKSRLQELDKTQDWLADKVGVSNNAVTKWIRSGKISRENAVKAAKYLEVTVDQLLGAEQRQPVNELKRQLIYFYDGMSEDHKEILLNMANNLYSLDNPHDKLAKPFSAETTTESGKIKQ